MCVSKTWEHFKNDPQLATFFPDLCLKKSPPREYFWKVFSVVKRAEYQQILANSKMKLSLSQQLLATKVNLQPEMKQILFNFDHQQSLTTLCKFKSSKASKSLRSTQLHK